MKLATARQIACLLLILVMLATFFVPYAFAVAAEETVQEDTSVPVEDLPEAELSEEDVPVLLADSIDVTGSFQLLGHAYRPSNNATFYYDAPGYPSIAFDRIYLRRVTVNGTEQVAYCIVPGRPSSNGSYTGSSVGSSDNWNYDLPYELTSLQQQAIGLVFLYGAPNSLSSSTFSTEVGCEFATQLLIWEIIIGIREAIFPYKCTNYGLRDSWTGRISFSRYSNGSSYTVNNVREAYDRIEADLQSHEVIPSFCHRLINLAPTHQMASNNDGTYTITLTDTNNILSKYTFTNGNGLDFEVNGSTLTVTATGDVSSTLVSPTKNIPSLTDASFLIWHDSRHQTMMSLADSVSDDPVPSYFNLRLPGGDIVGSKTTDTGNNLSGWEFQLKDGDTVVGTTASDSAGNFSFTNIPAGTYTLVENVPADSLYACSNNSQTVTITAGSTVTVNFHNTLQRGDLTVTKDAEDGLNEGVRFHLYGTAACGQAVDEYAETDATGKANFTDILIGTYTLEEVDVPERYVVPDGQTIEITWNTVSEKSFTNNIVRGAIMGKKVDEDGFAICGTMFGLFHPKETEFTDESALQIATSNEIGAFRFEDVPYGQYVIRELMPAPAFVLNETIYPVTIIKEGEVIELTVENSFITGSVETTKVDAEHPENKPSDAVFAVYVDVDSNAEFDASIDMKVGELEETDDGVYRMDGLRYNGYFLHEEVTPEGFLQDEGYYYFQIRSNGETVIVENKAGVGFINQPIIGELVLTKTDAADGKPLPNVGFRIKDESGTVVAEGCTDENGIVKFTLRYGKYTYEEIAPLEGYQSDTKEYPFEIREDGQVIQAAVTNTPIPVNPVTGDATQIGLLLCCIVVSGIGMAMILLLRRKKTA